MALISVLLVQTLALTVAADLLCPCEVRAITNISGGTSDSVAATCSDQDLQQVPGCVPNNTRLLYFSGNALLHIGPHTLGGLTKLRNLVVDHCQVANLSADAFQHTPELHLLNLGYNNLHELPAGIFDNTPLLQFVDLTKNMLHSLPGGLFKKVRGLKSLDLSRNYLVELPGDLIGACAPQSSLRVADNQLKELPVPLLHSCSSLYSLDVSDNRMTQMTPDVVSAISNLSDLHTLRLLDNPWHCDCNLKPLTLMLWRRTDLERHLTCASPQNVRDKHVVHVVSDMDCAPLPESHLPVEPSAHTAHPHRSNNAAFVALTAVGTISVVLTASFFVVRRYLKSNSARFNLLRNEEA